MKCLSVVFGRKSGVLLKDITKIVRVAKATCVGNVGAFYGGIF